MKRKLISSPVFVQNGEVGHFDFSLCQSASRLVHKGVTVVEQSDRSIEQLAINTIRTLSMDAVEAAKSGHPGTPMALAPVGYVISTTFCDLIRRVPYGSIGTALSSRVVTRRC